MSTPEFDPEKFTMEVAHGVKDGARLDGPDVVVPFCRAHRAWPCRYCGTSHFPGCECPVCVEPDNEALRRDELFLCAHGAIDDALEALDALKACLRKLKD